MPQDPTDAPKRESQSNANPEADAAGESSHRALCRKTGSIFQAAGLILTLSTCCWSWWSDDKVRSTEEGRAVPKLIRDARPDQIWGMAGKVLSFVAGMALIAIGLGLQNERLRAGRAAMWLTGAVAVFFWCYLGFAAFQFPSAGRIVAVAVLAVFWSLCFLLSGASADELKRFPPPTATESTWTSRDEDDLRTAISLRSRDRRNP